MPATATGRGAQVVVDPLSDTAKAIRGAYAATLEANAAKVAGDVLAGTVSDGNRQDGTTSTAAGATDVATVPTAGPQSFSGGISFTTTVASAADLSKHINLFAGTYGFNVQSGGQLNINGQSSGLVFNIAGSSIGYMAADGLNNMAIGNSLLGAGSFTQLKIASTAGPTIRAGTGVAAGTQPSGSIFIRTDGAAGARLYVSQGAGTWIAIATV